MPMRADYLNPAELTYQQRLQEVAAILAEGVCRMYRRPDIAGLTSSAPAPGAPADAGKNAPVSRPDCLELSAEIRPDGAVG
jgi:hypothetical protein